MRKPTAVIKYAAFEVSNFFRFFRFFRLGKLLKALSVLSVLSVFLSLSLYLPSASFALSSPEENIAQKIMRISGRFLNAPYLKEPLGEGQDAEFNQAPLYRFDKFDCETFVDTVLALAFSNSSADFKDWILNIRYQNAEQNFKPDFYHRNHFPEADWMRNNLKKKFIKFMPDMPSEISLDINKKNWYQNLPLDRINIPSISLDKKLKKLAKLHQYSETFKKNIMINLPYIPIDLLPQMIDKIPDGSIVFIIKPDFTLISHMGFGIWKRHKLYLRAASSEYGKVIDAPLLPYVLDGADTGIKGITILIPQNQN